MLDDLGFQRLWDDVRGYHLVLSNPIWGHSTLDKRRVGLVARIVAVD